LRYCHAIGADRRVDTLSGMEARELAVPGAFEFRPRTFPDSRGLFVAPFQESVFVATIGHPLHVAQSNHSVSRRGALRGVHFADVPPGQAKYVYCPRGALLDVVIDLRVGSPTFGRSDAVVVDSRDFRAVYLPEGVGHAFIALADDTVMSYLCTTGYNPHAEHGVHPLDPALALPWPADVPPILSDKDLAAPTLAEAEAAGLLPRYEDCQAHYAELRETALI
jgi:dTDP-4-dehydrorhamnose 3,5-epimerase